MNKFSILKSKIREFAELQGVSIKEIYKNTGISEGTLSNSSGLNEDNILKFFSYYNQVDANWLLKNEGAMINEKENKLLALEPKEKYTPKENGYTLEVQKKLIEELEQKVKQLQSEIKLLKKKK